MSWLSFQDSYTVDSAPDLTGRYYLVTGGSAGLGYQCGRYLLRKNATVVFHARNEAKLDEVLKAIMPEAGPKAKVEKLIIDLESFKSIKAGAEEYKSKGWPLHVLINNAGLFLPEHSITENGFEIQLQTNHYGPWLLTHLLLDVMKKTQAGTLGKRLVWTSSQASGSGEIDWEDLKGKKDKRSDFNMYAESKLMNLLTSVWMNKQLSSEGIESFAVHPGISDTDITSKQDNKFTAQAQQTFMPIIGQHEERAAMPLFRAAVDPSLTGQGGEGYLGPSRIVPNMGDVTAKRTPQNKQAGDLDNAARLYLETHKLVEEALGEKVPQA